MDGNELDRWGGRSIRISFAVLAILVCLHLAGGYSSAQDTRKIRVGYSALSLSFFPHLLAKDTGAFQRYGLDVDLVQMAGPLQVAALAAGELDFGAAVSPALFAAVRGLPLRGIMVTVKTPLFYLVSEPKIARADELVGKKLAVDSIGALQYIAARSMIEKKGGNPDKVSYFQTGSASNSLAALSSGVVNAAVLSIPLNVIMVQKGYHQLTSTQEAGVNFPPSGLTVHLNKLERDGPQVRRMITALLAAMRSIGSDRQGMTSYIERKWKLTNQLATEAYQLMLPTLIVNGRMSLEDVQEFLDVAYDNKQIQQKANSKLLMDYTLLDEVLKDPKNR